MPTQHIKHEKSVEADVRLEYRWNSIYLLAFYLPILILPWILTCILASRPLNYPSYINQQGIFTKDDVRDIGRVRTATDALSRIASTLAVPIVCAVLSQAAVVYAEHRKPGQRPLSVRQLFVLADGSWADVPTLWESLAHASMRTRFLWMGAGLVLVAAVQPALQSLLIPDDQKLIVTHDDTCIWGYGDGCSWSPQRPAGIDAEPGLLEQVPRDLIVQKVQSRVLSFDPKDVQEHLWPEPGFVSEGEEYSALDRGTLSYYYDSSSRSPNYQPTYFVSAFTNDTRTGVLRYHALRHNSTAKCEEVDHSLFPSECSGSRPFTTNYTRDGLDVRICVPGDYGKVPWTLSRNMQNVSEEFWLDVVIAEGSHSYYSLKPNTKDFAVHCTADSTRGYFELGNFQTNYAWGPLLEIWPSIADMESNFNDELFVSGKDLGKLAEPAPAIPIEWELTDSPFNTGTLKTPGPLMIAALALFGNSSFFVAAKNATEDTMEATVDIICQQSTVPFDSYGSDFASLSTAPAKYAVDICDPTSGARLANSSYNLDQLVWGSLQGFSDNDTAKEMLEITMYFANEIHLTSIGLQDQVSGRTVYTSPGTQVSKPRRSLPGIVIISLLISLQVIALVGLAWYTASTPTWTTKLDAFALARIGARLGPRLRDAGLDFDIGDHAGSVAALKALGKMNGLIGIEEHEKGEERRLLPIESRIESELELGEGRSASAASAGAPAALTAGKSEKTGRVLDI
ncbi:hypothetical protein NKR23_g1010 [Pleurostoma richardsiae]|uniref:Uncharacterized protein n=1 Tax=Pleurostoma richardsiae TaxID=41990 RepID=A0AA38VXA1_9PEZI|nr:hypothetical protein NKR23_g1010 [Pleurostoma richardsiae]